MGFLIQCWPTPSSEASSILRKKKEGQFPDKYQGGEGGEGCVVTLGSDWAITEIDSKQSCNKKLREGSLWRAVDGRVRTYLRVQCLDLISNSV